MFLIMHRLIQYQMNIYRICLFPVLVKIITIILVKTKIKLLMINIQKSKINNLIKEQITHRIMIII